MLALALYIRIGSCVAASNGQDALVGVLYLFIYTLGIYTFLLLALASRPCIALFQSSQSPFVIAEENRRSHHYSDRILLLLEDN